MNKKLLDGKYSFEWKKKNIKNLSKREKLLNRDASNIRI